MRVSLLLPFPPFLHRVAASRMCVRVAACAVTMCDPQCCCAASTTEVHAASASTF